MSVKNLHIKLSIIVLLIIAGTVFFTVSGKKRLTPTSGFAFSFLIAGIVFGENRFLEYSLIGIGIFPAVIDKFKKT